MPATLLGAGLYAAFLALQVLQGPAALRSGLIFKIPVAMLLFVAVIAALCRRVAPGKTSVERLAEEIPK